ncbi:MAG: ClC family H(+)/Cl(-) exchange transporter [Tissierellales bacterium]|nr:ClC family H(+)/Cl(-) exchange transporter [Tissierellales bacterium]MBN2827829.1 ClC family H(+)/Cl(-) exchange transporter [Tissierellales bacterium]
MKDTNHNTASTIINHLYGAKTLIIGQCLVLGVFVGLFVSAYRFLLDFAAKWFDQYVFIYWTNPMSVLLTFFVLILCAYLVKKIIAYEPFSSGSGIPQVKGYIFRIMKMPWKNILIFKFLGGILSAGAGLSLGREGPSIQIGAAVGKGFSELFKRENFEKKYYVTGGAGAGLAAAFNAPLAGVIFALEELHKNFSPFIVITVLATTISAEFVSESFYGSSPVLDFDIVDSLPLHYYGFIIVLGVILGLFGVLYNRLIVKSLNFFSSNRLIHKNYKIFPVFILSGLLVVFLPEVTRGGHHIIEPIVHLDYGIKFLLLILLVKFIFSLLSYGTGAPGGIFLPILVIGALTGSIYGQFLSLFFNMENLYIQNMVIFSMAGLLTAIVRAPITSSLLICEMTGSFTHFLPVTIVVIISHLIPEFFNCPPIYDTFLERVTKSSDTKYIANEKAKILIEKTIALHSLADHSKIRDIKWPRKCLIVNINRENKDIIPTGDFELRTADILTFITDETIAGDIKEKLGYITDYSIVEKM